ncbi:MAG: dimerization domain, partial [Candidatus Eisenbacteria bacterium]
MVPDEARGSESLVPPVMRLVWGFMVSQAIHVAAKMSIFDRLRDGPRT